MPNLATLVSAPPSFIGLNGQTLLARFTLAGENFLAPKSDDLLLVVNEQGKHLFEVF